MQCISITRLRDHYKVNLRVDQSKHNIKVNKQSVISNQNQIEDGENVTNIFKEIAFTQPNAKTYPHTHFGYRKQLWWFWSSNYKVCTIRYIKIHWKLLKVNRYLLLFSHMYSVLIYICTNNQNFFGSFFFQSWKQADSGRSSSNTIFGKTGRS